MMISPLIADTYFTIVLYGSTVYSWFRQPVMIQRARSPRSGEINRRLDAFRRRGSAYSVKAYKSKIRIKREVNGIHARHTLMISTLTNIARNRTGTKLSRQSRACLSVAGGSILGENYAADAEGAACKINGERRYFYSSG